MPVSLEGGRLSHERPLDEGVHLRFELLRDGADGHSGGDLEAVVLFAIGSVQVSRRMPVSAADVQAFGRGLRQVLRERSGVAALLDTAGGETLTITASAAREPYCLVRVFWPGNLPRGGELAPGESCHMVALREPRVAVAFWLIEGMLLDYDEVARLATYVAQESAAAAPGSDPAR